MSGLIEKVDLATRDNCTGCGACYVACPTKSIEMITDDEGFVYPSVHNSCVSCRICINICPVLNQSKKAIKEAQVACCAIHKDFDTWKKSSSGGAFSAICELFCANDSVIFGAIYDSSTHSIRHIGVTGVNNIDCFRGSKYVQSNIENCFQEIKCLLNNGRKVVFSGTPCQVAAIRNYLKNQNTDNLLCIDILCHGVGSPAVFKDYLAAIENKAGTPIKDYQFRSKKIHLGVHKLYVSRITFDNGKVIYKTNDLFTNLFLQKILCRPSCDHCQFTCTDRVGDLTIGDFKQMYTIFPNAAGNRNGSAIVANTSLGKEIFSKLSSIMCVYPCDVQDIANTNDPFSKTSQSPKNRHTFFEDYQNDKENIYEKYNKKLSVKQIIIRNIPDKLRAKIKGWIGHR